MFRAKLFPIIAGIVVAVGLVELVLVVSQATHPAAKEELVHRWVASQVLVCDGDPEESVVPWHCWRMQLCAEHQEMRWQEIPLGEAIEPVPLEREPQSLRIGQ